MWIKATKLSGESTYVNMSDATVVTRGVFQYEDGRSIECTVISMKAQSNTGVGLAECVTEGPEAVMEAAGVRVTDVYETAQAHKERFEDLLGKGVGLNPPHTKASRPKSQKKKSKSTAKRANGAAPRPH